MKQQMVPPHAEEMIFEGKGGQARVLFGGDRQSDDLPVVLIHGGGYDHSGISWYSFYNAFGSRVKMGVDLPGFGGSKQHDLLSDPSELAEYITETLEKMGMKKYIVFGLSMGGDVALNIALAQPEKVRGLVLIAPGGLVPIFKNAFLHTVAWMGVKLPRPLLDLATPLANRFAKPAVRSMVKDINQLPTEIVDEFIREAKTRKAGVAYGRYNRATIGRRTMENNVLPDVHKIKAPTLLFHGDSDPMVDIEGSRQAAAKIPNNRLVIAPNCGHWAHLEAETLFRAVVEDFFRSYDL